MTRRGGLVTGAVVLLLLSGCGRGAIDRTGTPGLDIAEAALKGGSPEIALQVADGVLKSNGSNVDALCVQGDALTELGHMDEATASYSAARKLDPNSIRARLGLARLRLGTDPAGAETLYLEVLQHDPRNVVALSDLGIARDLLGRHADAQDAYRRALGINPELQAAQVNLALSLAMSGDGQNATRILRPLATGPGASRKLRHDYAAVLAMSGNRSEAEQVLAPDLSATEINQFLDTMGNRGQAQAVSLLAAPVPLAASEPLAGDNGVQVQLAASPSEDAAQAEWQHLEEQLPTVLAGHQAVVTRNDHDGHTFWRLRTNGFTDAAAAKAFCDQLRSANAACMVVTR
jgi:Flp pilus assembly protein TadD